MNDPSTPISESDPTRRARRQLGRVLMLLGLLDLTVLLFVLALALERTALGLSDVELLAIIVTGAGFVILTRVLLAVRLRARAGDL